MKKPIYYYTNRPTFGEYDLGCCPCPPKPCPPCPPPKPHYHGKVSVVGRTVLTIKYVDRHGHYQTFDVKDGETYEFTAVSSTRGICTFTGRIVDFECSKGIEKLLDKPHEILISALIVDYSDAYESKLMRLYINNIIGIKPIRCFEDDCCTHHSHHECDDEPCCPQTPIINPFE